MEDEFLDASCVFENLIKSGFIDKKDWKHNTIERYYDAAFIRSGTRGSIVVFRIVVQDGSHKLFKSRLRFMENYFSKNFRNIFTACTIK